MVDSKLAGSRSGITRDGIGYEVHYNVEQNTKGFNRKMSVSLYYQGGDNVDTDRRIMSLAAIRANDIAFQGQNRLENKLRRMHGMDILNPVDGSLLGHNIAEPNWDVEEEV